MTIIYALKKNKNLPFFLIMVLLMFLIFCNADNNSGNLPNFDPSKMKEISVPMKIIRATSDTPLRFIWPDIDFEDHGWISRNPVEDSLTGLPQENKILFYGIFQMCAGQAILGFAGAEEAKSQVWVDYDWAVKADSKISFINVTTQNGEDAFYFDTNNNEDFSDETIVLSEKFPDGVFAGTSVEFEYQDSGCLKIKSAFIQVYKFSKYNKPRPDPTFPKFRGSIKEYLQGSFVFKNKPMNVAVYNGGRYATYGTKAWNEVIFDLNNDGTFNIDPHSRECYPAREPFNISGVTFYVKKITPSGDELVLQVSDTTVAVKKELQIGEPAPEFSVTDVNGTEIKLSDLRGKVILLDFWATWCYPCIKSTPLLQTLFNTMNKSDFLIIGISLDVKPEPLQKYISENNVKWIQIMNKENQLKKLYNVHGIPEYFIIDRQGKLVEKDPSGKMLPDLIKKYL